MSKRAFLPFLDNAFERHDFSFGELVSFNAEYACFRCEDVIADRDTVPVRHPRDRRSTARRQSRR